MKRECRKLSLVGLGGIGKTQVALRFAYMVKEIWPDYSIFWLPALSWGSFEQAYANIAKKLGIYPASKSEEDVKETVKKLDIRLAAESKGDVKEVVKKHLSRNRAGKWLLVVDNADDMDIMIGREKTPGIVDYLPEKDEGVVLFTTRTLKVAGRLTGSNVLKIGTMDPDDAATFLSKSLICKMDDESATKDLLDELMSLPLAIKQAAAYLNENGITVREYSRLLRSKESNLVDLMSREFRDDGRYKDSANAVATTWMVSFNQIRARDRVAVDLLYFMSCIEWKAIPYSILPRAESDVRMKEAIGILCAYSFLTQREGTHDREYAHSPKYVVRREDETWYDLHRLVHLSIRIWLKQNARATRVTKRAIKHITRIFPTAHYEGQKVRQA